MTVRRTSAWKKDKGIDPTLPGQWEVERDLQRRLAVPDRHSGSYTNVSNTTEQCISGHAHVIGFAVSYHDYQTHKSYYQKQTRLPDNNTSTLAGVKTSSSSMASPQSGTKGMNLGPSTHTTV